MIPEAEQGRYTISARTDKGEKILHGFDIKEYGGFQLPSPASRPRGPALNRVSSAPVLPKYEVKVHLPQVITILDREATFRICGKWVSFPPEGIGASSLL